MFAFLGKVDIEVESQEPRDYFLTHIKYLEVMSAKLTRNGTNIDIIEAMEYPPNEFFVIRTSKIVDPGKYIIHFGKIYIIYAVPLQQGSVLVLQSFFNICFLEFRGNLTQGLVGFYKSVYTNNKGKKIPIATSKFQPTYARRAFPCFDEPSFKSTFTVTLIRPSVGYIALSNMPVRNEISNSPSNGFTEVQVLIQY